MLIVTIAAIIIAQVEPQPQPAPLKAETWVTPDDYPAPALRDAEEGRVSYRLNVDENGSVTGCTIVTSSGSGVLDVHTCDLMRLRAHFDPARDSKHRVVPSEYSAGVTWALPDGRAWDVAAVAPVDRTTIEFVVNSDGRVKSCVVVEATGSPANARGFSPCDKYPSGSRYTDPTVRDGRPVGGRIRRTVVETKSYYQR